VRVLLMGVFCDRGIVDSLGVCYEKPFAGDRADTRDYDTWVSVIKISSYATLPEIFLPSS